MPLLGLSVVAVLVAIVVVPRLGSSSLLKVGDTAPTLTLTAEDGHSYSLPADTGGRPLVLEFMEVTCPHCQEAAPALCRLAQSHTEARFVAVAAGLEDAAALRGFRQSHMADCGSTLFPLLVDPGGAVTKSYKVRAVPAAYVIDTQGRIAYAGSGASGIDGISGALTRVGSHG
jgi:peroxiredoxin